MVDQQNIERIQKEYKELTDNPISNVSASPVDEANISHWKVTIIGPENTPFSGGKFHLDVNFPPYYPYMRPKVLFMTKIYHPNISKHGTICLDILEDHWSPVLTISKVLSRIVDLIINPNFADPLVLEVSRIYQTDKSEYETIARDWVQKYAS